MIKKMLIIFLLLIFIVSAREYTQDYNNALTRSIANTLYCGIDNCGNGTSDNTSYWNRTGTNLYPSSIGDSVGIGTPTPDTLLHVRKTTTGNNYITVDSNVSGAGFDFTAADTHNWCMLASTANELAFREDCSSAKEYLTIDTHNVGINNNNPRAALDVFEDGSNTLPPSISSQTIAIFTNNDGALNGANISLLGGNASRGGVQFGDSEVENAGGVYYDHSLDQLELVAGYIASVFVSGEGDIGINYSNPSHTLEVSGSTRFENQFSTDRLLDLDGSTNPYTQSTDSFNLYSHRLFNGTGSANQNIYNQYNLLASSKNLSGGAFQNMYYYNVYNNIAYSTPKVNSFIGGFEWLYNNYNLITLTRTQIGSGNVLTYVYGDYIDINDNSNFNTTGVSQTKNTYAQYIDISSNYWVDLGGIIDNVYGTYYKMDGTVDNTTSYAAAIYIEEIEPFDSAYSIVDDSGTPQVISSDTGYISFGEGNDTVMGFDGTAFYVDSKGANIEFRNNSNWATIIYGAAVEMTTLYDSAMGEAVDLIRDVSEYRYPDGTLNKEDHYAYTEVEVKDNSNCWQEIDYVKYCYGLDNNMICLKEAIADWQRFPEIHNETIIPRYYEQCGTKIIKGLNTNVRVATTEQAIYELKTEIEALKEALCSLDQRQFCS